MDNYAFPEHDLNKFHDYTYFAVYNGFILKDSDKRYYFDENNGYWNYQQRWCDLNGCYFDGNEQPAGWIELSSDGKSFTQYNMAKEKVLEGQNFYYGSENHNPSGKPLKLKEFQALKAPQQTLKQFQQEVQKKAEAEQREFAGYDAESDQQYRDQQKYRRGGQRFENHKSNINDRQNRISIGGYGGDDYNRNETQGNPRGNNNNTRNKNDSNLFNQRQFDDQRNERGQNRQQDRGQNRDNRRDDQRNDRGQDNRHDRGGDRRDEHRNDRVQDNRYDQRKDRGQDNRRDGYNQQHNRQEQDNYRPENKRNNNNDNRRDNQERNSQTINDDDYRKKQNNNQDRQQNQSFRPQQSQYNNNRQFDPDNFRPRNKNIHQQHQRKYSDDQNTKQQYQEKKTQDTTNKIKNNQNSQIESTIQQKQVPNSNSNPKSGNEIPIQKGNEHAAQKKDDIKSAEQIISLKQPENKQQVNDAKPEARNESQYATIEITDRFEKVTEQDIIDHIQKVSNVKRSSIIKVTDKQIVVASLDEALLIYKQFKKHEGIQLIQVALK